MTIPVVASLRKKYPESEILFLVRENFGKKLEDLFDQAKIIRLPVENLVRLSLVSPTLGVKALKDFLRSPDFEDIDLAINMSFSSVGLAFTKHIKAASWRGPHMVNGVESIQDDGSFYIRAHIQGGDGTNDMHLAPLFASVADVPVMLPKDVPLKSERINLSDDFEIDGPIVLAPDASHKSKTWPLSDWMAITQHCKKNLKKDVIVLGLDREAGESLARLGAIDLTGPRTVSELIQILRQASRLITHDSGLAHLGAFWNIPQMILGVNVRLNETLAHSMKAVGFNLGEITLSEIFQWIAIPDRTLGYHWVGNRVEVTRSTVKDVFNSTMRKWWRSAIQNSLTEEKRPEADLIGMLQIGAHQLLRLLNHKRDFIASIQDNMKNYGKILEKDPGTVVRQLQEFRDTERSLYSAHPICRHVLEEIWLEENLSSGEVSQMLENNRQLVIRQIEVVDRLNRWLMVTERGETWKTPPSLQDKSVTR